MKTSSNKSVFNLKEATAYLGISVPTLVRLLGSGAIPYRRVGQRWLIIQYGHPGKKPTMWLNSIMNAEMEFFSGVMHGDPIPDEFKPLMTGEAARAAIATADAATLSLRENRKVSVEEVMK